MRQGAYALRWPPRHRSHCVQLDEAVLAQSGRNLVAAPVGAGAPVRGVTLSPCWHAEPARMGQAALSIGGAVELLEHQVSRGLVRGDVGTVVQRYGDPPTHYLVNVAAVAAFGIFPAGHLRAAMDGVLSRPSGIGTPTMPQRSSEDALARTLWAPLWSADRCKATTKDPTFVEPYGLFVDLTLPPTPGSKLDHYLLGAFFARGVNGQLSMQPSLPISYLRRRRAHSELGVPVPDEIGASIRAQPTFSGLPTELKQTIIGLSCNEGLTTWAQVDRECRALADAEATKPARRAHFEYALRSAHKGWSDVVAKQQVVAQNLPQPLMFPTIATRDEIVRCARILARSTKRPRARFFNLSCLRRMAGMPASVDLEWSFCLDQLLSEHDVPKCPPSLRTVELHARQASRAGLDALTAQLPAGVALSVFVETWAVGDACVQEQPALHTLSMTLPSAALATDELGHWLQSTALRRLSLRGFTGPPPGALTPPQATSTAHSIGDGLRSLHCEAPLLGRITGFTAHCGLRSLHLFGQQWDVAIPLVRRLPFVEEVRLEEVPEPQGDSVPPTQTLGAALAQGELGWSVRILRVRAPSLKDALPNIVWPAYLVHLDLSGSLLGGVAGKLNVRDTNIEVLTLERCECDDSLMQVAWPPSLRRVELNLSSFLTHGWWRSLPSDSNPRFVTH